MTAREALSTSAEGGNVLYRRPYILVSLLPSPVLTYLTKLHRKRILVLHIATSYPTAKWPFETVLEDGYKFITYNGYIHQSPSLKFDHRVFYTHFYKHARRLRLECGGFRRETAVSKVKRPLRNCP
jgi:hypothetical protein